MTKPQTPGFACTNPQIISNSGVSWLNSRTSVARYGASLETYWLRTAAPTARPRAAALSVWTYGSRSAARNSSTIRATDAASPVVWHSPFVSALAKSAVNASADFPSFAANASLYGRVALPAWARMLERTFLRTALSLSAPHRDAVVVGRRAEAAVVARTSAAAFASAASPSTSQRPLARFCDFANFVARRSVPSPRQPGFVGVPLRAACSWHCSLAAPSLPAVTSFAALHRPAGVTANTGPTRRMPSSRLHPRVACRRSCTAQRPTTWVLRLRVPASSERAPA